MYGDDTSIIVKLKFPIKYDEELEDAERILSHARILLDNEKARFKAENDAIEAERKTKIKRAASRKVKANVITNV